MKIRNSKDENILEILKSENVDIENPCRGKGICGKCKIKILNGEVSPLTEDEAKLLSKEEISNGVRLACLTKPIECVDIDILFNENKQSNILTEGAMPNFNIEPPLKLKDFKLVKPTLENIKSLSECLEESLNLKGNISMNVLKKLPSFINREEGQGVFYYDELIDIIDKDEKIYGVAVDIGTTTVACSLIDMESFKVIGNSSFINPQKDYGLDVLSRIHYSNENEEGVGKLQSAIVKELNLNIEELCNSNGIKKSAIYEVVIGANSTMVHCLLGIPLASLGKAPYANVVNDAVTLLSSEIGININSYGRLYCVPSVSTFIGGDIVAGVLASRIYDKKENILFIDIGTNGEIVLSNHGELISCSCAAGPALEGMNISCGMRASDGAVEGVKIDRDKINLKVIGDEKPKGICGSGILDIVWQLLDNNILGANGRLKADSSLVSEVDGKREVTLYNEEGNRIYITQKDIRQVQLAKGAILSGFLALVKYKGLDMSDLDRIVVAGQFGKHLSKDSLTGVGIIPKELKEKIEYIGNSSKSGAFMCLLSKGEREISEKISKDIEYVELSTIDNYEKIFTKALMF